MSNPNTRKSCVVPKCINTTTNAPEKLFFVVPMDAQMRMKWIKAMRRLDPFGPKSIVYCCEDHFDIETDMDNYIKFKLVGGSVKLKKGTVPHKFKCQQEFEENPQRYAVQKRKQRKCFKKLLRKDEESMSWILDATVKPEEPSYAGRLFPVDPDQVSIHDEDSRSEPGEQPDESEGEVSHDDKNLEHGETSHVSEVHEGFQCNECFGDIIGFRYICMQCADWDLCGACEARAAHADHLVLRVPKPQTYSEAKTMIDSIRSTISNFLQAKEEEDRESFKIKVKQENDSDDDDGNDDQLNSEPELNMYPEARTQRTMLKLNKEEQILINVRNMELVLDPLSSSEERAVPTTHLGQDKPKIKLKRAQSSSLLAKSSSESHQHQDASITVKEDPTSIDYEASIDSEQNKDNLHCFIVNPHTVRDETWDNGNTKRKKYC